MPKYIAVKRNIIMIIAGVVVLCLLSSYLITYSAIFNPEDKTKEEVEWAKHKEVTVEGSFLDANDKVIFSPEKDYFNDTTYMPLSYSYVLGYNHPKFETSGLRQRYEKHLYNDEGTGKGPSIKLTIDDILQNKAYTALQENDFEGSVVVLNAKTAEILAMAGRREKDFDINKLISLNHEGKNDEERQKARDLVWAEYENTDNMFLNPATRDFKAPGSVFKILTSAAAINNSKADFMYPDTGEIIVNNTPIHNAESQPLGEIGLEKALVHSTNTYFAALSMELGERPLKYMFDTFLVGKEIDLGFEVLKSSAVFDGDIFNLAQMGFGQGKIDISPLHIAMIGQSIVNEGKMLKPTIIKALYDVNGNPVVKEETHELLTKTISPELCEEIKSLMATVTTDSPYYRLPDCNTPIYTKTGTAQKDSGNHKYNSYFLCMTEDYVIVVSINDTDLFGSQLAYIAERFLLELY